MVAPLFLPPFLLFLASLLASGNGLECYACSGPNCQENSNIALWSTIRCPNTMYCLKFSINNGPFARNCGRNCESITGRLPQASDTYCYECQGDLCNAAHRLSAPLPLLPLLLLLLLPLLLRR